MGLSDKKLQGVRRTKMGMVFQPADLSADECAADPCDLGFTPADIRVVANNEFLAANAAADALFEAVEIPAADIAAQNLQMNEGADTQQDIEQQAQEWIDANRDQVDQWLEAARSAIAWPHTA